MGEGTLAYKMVNRVVNVGMVGTYGYVPKSFRESGGVMLTATSTVEEFLIEDMQRMGEELEWCFIGTDYYGRKLELPIPRIRWMKPQDTLEQGRLRQLNKALYFLENEVFKDDDVTEDVKAAREAIMKSFEKHIEERDELLAKGITEYEPKRAKEDEL